MKRGKRFLFIILAFLIIFGGIAIWQRDNIKAVIDSFNYSEEELSKMIAGNKEALEAELKEKYNIVGTFTEEDEKKIMSGEMSVEEAVAMKLKELDEINKQNDNISPEAKKKTDKIVSEKIIEFYSLKAYYLGQLGQMEAKVLADYIALPKEKQNLVGKKELVSKYMSVATALLNQCDAKVDELTKEMETEIKAVGGDLSIIKLVKEAYENEKNLKKSYYISKLK